MSTAAGGQQLSVGFLLGSYEILALLGAGGMGIVYCALDTKLRRKVAIKVVPPSDEVRRRVGAGDK
jgi:serine/threonine protein kinase